MLKMLKKIKKESANITERVLFSEILMKEKFGVTEVQVRGKLRDILKPNMAKAKQGKFD
jgi:hypothetical protein